MHAALPVRHSHSLSPFDNDYHQHRHGTGARHLAPRHHGRDRQSKRTRPGRSARYGKEGGASLLYSKMKKASKNALFGKRARFRHPSIPETLSISWCVVLEDFWGEKHKSIILWWTTKLFRFRLAICVCALVAWKQPERAIAALLRGRWMLRFVEWDSFKIVIIRRHLRMEKQRIINRVDATLSVRMKR